MIVLTLPLPPTINHYYGQGRNGKRFIKPAGIEFRKAVSDVVAAAGHKKLEGRVCLFAAIYPATRAKQDLDNRAKAMQDALTEAGVWKDDSQIDELHLIRREVVRGGMVKVVITELQGAK